MSNETSPAQLNDVMLLQNMLLHTSDSSNEYTGIFQFYSHKMHYLNINVGS